MVIYSIKNFQKNRLFFYATLFHLPYLISGVTLSVVISYHFNRLQYFENFLRPIVIFQI